MLFAETGFRPLWPVIFFLPWFLIGIACLLVPVLRLLIPSSIGSILRHGPWRRR